MFVKSQAAVVNEACGCVKEHLGGAAKHKSFLEPFETTAPRRARPVQEGTTGGRPQGFIASRPFG